MSRADRRSWPAPAGASMLRAVAMAWLLGAALASHADTAAPARISIKDFMFSPLSLTVPAGTTVTWINLDGEPHTAVSDTGLFRSAAMDTNESFSFKFDKPGTYHFTCSIHPRMVGIIVVQ